jgi:hypothetical protein
MWLPVVALIVVLTLTAVVLVNRTLGLIAKSGEQQEVQQTKLDLSQVWDDAASAHATQTLALMLAPDDILRQAVAPRQQATSKALSCWRRPKTEPLSRVVPTQN